MHPGEKIRDFRKKKGFTQKDFAKMMDYSGGYLATIELGKVEPSREFLKKLNEIFCISSDYILYGSEEEQKKYLMVKEAEVQYKILPTSTKKLLDNVKEILESKNEVMIDALKANIKAFLVSVRSKKENENKGGD
jgi:transcriptional regulator with XRE-family HTH domain